MLEIVPFQAEHLIGLISITKNARKAIDIERNMESGGFARSVFIDGACLAVGGAVRIYGKVYHLWAHIGPELETRKVTLHRIARQLFAEFSSECAWERLEVDCATALKKNCRWVEAFGLTAYGVKRKGGPNGEDMTLFERVR